MLCVVARIAAILIWMPGVGIPIAGTRMLSLYEVVIAILLLPIMISSIEPRRLVFGSIALGVCSIGLIFSIDRSTSAPYFLYYALVIIPHMLLFLQIFENESATCEFLRAYVGTGVFLGPIALLQFLSPVPITLLNNTNYHLQIGAVHRAQLFAPEASLLAAMYVIAISVAIYSARRNLDPGGPYGGWSIASMIIGLGTTVSTSAIALLPAMLLLIFKLTGASWRSLLKYIFLVSVLLPIFYFLLYRDRVASGDSTTSIIFRLASMVVGMQVVAQHIWTGLGLGMSSTVSDLVTTLYLEWSGQLDQKPGVDSFQLALAAEMGILPAIISVGALWIFFRTIRIRREGQKIFELLAMFGIAVWVVSLLTSGYRGLPYCWLFFPAAYALFFRTRQSSYQFHNTQNLGPRAV